VPVPEVATVDPDNDRFPRHRRWLVSGGTVIPQARLAGAEVGVLPGGDLVQMLANGLGGAGDRQDVLEQGGGHAEGDQGCPTALHQRLSRYSSSGAVCSVNSSASGLKCPPGGTDSGKSAGLRAEHGRTRCGRVLSLAT
jgi:hypothetical protein